jgi:hypothetical protein
MHTYVQVKKKARKEFNLNGWWVQVVVASGGCPGVEGGGGNQVGGACSLSHTAASLRPNSQLG